MAPAAHSRTKNTGAAARFQWSALVPIALLVGILFSMGWGISEVVPRLETSLTCVILVVGFAVGWFVAKYSRHGVPAVLFSLFGGALFSSMTIGRLWDELWKLVVDLVVWGHATAEALMRTLGGEAVRLPYQQLFSIIHAFTESVFFMLQRLGLWLWHFPQMEGDLIATLLVWGWVVWLVSMWASWSVVRRRHPLEAVIPAFLIVAAARMYANASTTPLLLMLGLAVLLVVLSGQADREKDWQARRLGVSELIRKYATQTALALSAVLVFTAWGITSIDFEKVQDLWEELTNKQYYYRSGEISGSLGIEQDEMRTLLVEDFSRLRRGNLPNSHLIGSGPDLAEDVVMSVRVAEIDPLTGDVMAVDPAAQRYYLRSLTFDEYSMRGWYSTSTKIYAYQGGQEAVSSYADHQRLIRQQVTFTQKPDGLTEIFVVGDVVVVDRPYNISWREGNGLGDFWDVFGATLEAKSYEAYSLIPVYAENDLRNAGTDYPDWVLSRYLQLPQTLPDRVVDLAFEVTQNALNNYDKAVAIEQYLRTFPYTLDLPERPTKVDLVDYFLFNVQEGYCDYYASSMVVLARAVGIPARLATGYVGSNYDPASDTYIVTADQAHSWVEIYFPAYGWVTFEPTAGLPAVERQNLDVGLPAFEQEIVQDVEVPTLVGLRSVLQGSLVVVGVALLMGVIGLRVDAFLLRKMPVEKALRLIYRRLIRLMERLGLGSGDFQTPQEFSESVQRTLKIWILNYPYLHFLAKTVQTLESLIGLINQAAFSPTHLDREEQDWAVACWVNLWRQVVGAVVIKWLADRLSWGRVRGEKQAG